MGKLANGRIGWLPSLWQDCFYSTPEIGFLRLSLRVRMRGLASFGGPPKLFLPLNSGCFP